MKHQHDEPLGNAFDITWLTVVCIKLKEIKAGKKPRVRAKGAVRCIERACQSSSAVSRVRMEVVELAANFRGRQMRVTWPSSLGGPARRSRTVLCRARTLAATRGARWHLVDGAAVDAKNLAIASELARIGYVDGRNIAGIELRAADGDLGRLPAVAQQTVVTKPDVLIGASAATAEVLVAATENIPMLHIRHDRSDRDRAERQHVASEPEYNRVHVLDPDAGRQVG